MEKKLKRLAKEFLPPVLTKLLSGKSRYGFFGDFATWEEAKKASTGYDSDLILAKVKNSLLKVKNGEAVYERDSVIFDEIQYSWPLLASLLWIASQNRNKLNLIDFGGSLGSSYFQNIKFLHHLDDLKWNIVEQKHFVECGKNYFANEQLNFYFSINECLKARKPDTILLSSIIQYLEKPYDLLEEIINQRFTHIIFDRIPFLGEGNDRITIQKIPPEIYDASYPAWFFNIDKFSKYLFEKYDLIAEFDALDKANIASVFKGMIYRKC